MKVIAALLVVTPAAAFLAQPSKTGAVLRSSTQNDYNTMTTTGMDSRAVGSVTAMRQTPVKDVNSKSVDDGTVVAVQGGSLKTWSFADPRVDKVKVLLATEGRPLKSNVELWQGPDNTPYKLDVYLEDGDLRPFEALVQTPGPDRPSSSTIKTPPH